jgi:hypothetical protein
VLCGIGVIAQPPPLPGQSPTRPASPIIESNIVVASEARQLISPVEWRILVEGIHRVSQVVAHLVGSQEALQVLRDILDDCASSFPAFDSLTIASSGSLQVTDQTQLNRLPRENLLEGFAALFAICQHFCTPLVGERETHRLMLLALRELSGPLTSLGVFRADHLLLISGEV